MKNPVWWCQFPIIAIFTACMWITDWGASGDLDSKFLRENVYEWLRNTSSWFKDKKFEIRGARAVKDKIIIVGIDDESLAQIGRWPWNRNVTAKLIDGIYAFGAKSVALDIVFAEPQEVMPGQIVEILKAYNLGGLAEDFNYDAVLAKVFEKHKKSLVAGWAFNGICQPKFSPSQECPVMDQEIRALASTDYDRFAIPKNEATKSVEWTKTPLPSAIFPIPNIPLLGSKLSTIGHLQTDPDPDGRIRRTNLVFAFQGNLYSSLPLAMAQVAYGEFPEIEMTPEGKIQSFRFRKSAVDIETTPLGLLDVNFAGPRYSFHEVSAAQIINYKEGEPVLVATSQSLEFQKFDPKEYFKDAFVFVGSTALGAHDMRSFPLAPSVPGVIAHANVLENILNSNYLKTRIGGFTNWILTLVMVVGMLVFGFAITRMESVPALGLFAAVFSGSAYADVGLLFSNNIHLNTSFFYIEILTLFGFTLAVKYVLEEKNKKFLKNAFTKYVSADLVETIIKDPSKLSLGGEKRELTIMFSDIRSFTTFSEKMDAKALATFLNDYLSIMTDIVFKFGGTLDKYIGDAVMAFWGAPVKQEKHAKNACLAAIEMQKYLVENRSRFKSQYGIDVNIGVGINSGAVNVGNMGSSRVFEYTVIGDHVNLASRLEGLTKPYGAGILTTRFTFDQISAAHETPPPHRILDFVKVKGKKQAVEIIQILERNFSKEELEKFDKARALYSQRQWDDAIRLFSETKNSLAADKDSPDEISQTYIERCEEFKKNPPSADWDGSWVMTSK